MLCKKQKSLLRVHLAAKQNEAGQILMIVILVIVVVLTIGLSLASRSIINLKTSTEEAESQKALAAAQAGIERAIQGNVPVAVSNLSVLDSEGKKNSSYNTTVTAVNGLSFLLNGGNVIPKDEGADLWLSTYSSDSDSNYGSPLWAGDLSIYWGNDSVNPCNNPALEIIIVSGTKTNPLSKKYAYDPCPLRQSGNKFSSPSPSGGKAIDSKTFIYKVTINISAASPGLIARVIPIYGNAVVGIEGTSAFPLQGYKIDSTGTSGQANRKITVFKGWPQAYLPYLSYGLFVVK